MASDQIVLITGASRGFGAAAARAIARRGNTVIAAMRNPADGPATVAGLEDRIHAVELDVTRPEQVERVVEQAMQRFGRIDVLVNNAGYGLYGPIEEVTEDELWRQIDTNLFGQWRMMKAVIPHMRVRQQGKIANVSSLAGRVAGPLIGHYAAVKHGVEAMSEGARFELLNAGVQVTIMEPGMFRSDWQTESLDVCEAVREGRSAYPGVGEALAAFREAGASRPGPGSVAEGIADMVELEQPLPMRWPIGNDAIEMIPARLRLPDAVWTHLVRTGAFGSFRGWMYAHTPQVEGEIGRWGGENVVLITGASRGFGEAAARELAARGNIVVATMRNPGRDAANVIRGFEDRIHPVELDVMDSAGVASAVAWSLQRFGRLDAVINNAGYGLYGPVEDLNEAEVRRQIDTNFVGQWRLVRAAMPHMRERRRGKFLNVSSLSGAVASAVTSFYAASKHMVEAMTEALAEETRQWGIQATSIEPGMYRSDWQTTNLDVCETVREGRSPYQKGLDRLLSNFRARAITRPSSDSVAQGMADIVQLEQALPLRWPIGEDCVRMTQARRLTDDDTWERERLESGWGFTREDLEASGAFGAPVRA
jgi:NAD(P)-dependent dehydrogenase (short-subunit alcohol dehydrogenase family)